MPSRVACVRACLRSRCVRLLLPLLPRWYPGLARARSYRHGVLVVVRSLEEVLITKNKNIKKRRTKNGAEVHVTAPPHLFVPTPALLGVAAPIRAHSGHVRVRLVG